MTTNSPAVRRSEHNRFPSSRRPRTALALLSAAFTAAMLVSAGCVGYRLGSTLPADLKSIHVPTFVNQAGEPELESETTKAAIREFQKDGNLRVVNAGESDSVLEVTLVKYWL